MSNPDGRLLPPREGGESAEPEGARTHKEEAGLDSLYREVIKEHQRRPRNFGIIEGAEIETLGNNPVCGDRLTVYAHVNDGKLATVAFKGKACAICTASASMMTGVVAGKTLEKRAAWRTRSRR